jgi:hypothetical protein
MKISDSKTVLTEKDEYLHEPSTESKWRESYYFNWVDLQNQISGFSTIGILPNENRRELVFFLFLKEKNEIYYKEPKLSNYENNIDTMLRDKRLSYKLIEPFKIWQIEYQSHKIQFNLIFKTRFPTYNFGLSSSASWRQHFEASGIIKGDVVINNSTRIKINGYGQRDKSWGYRDWHEFDKWYAGHFQFKHWSCTFRKDYHMGRIDLSGHISREEGNTPLSSLEIETINDNDRFKSPLISNYFITDKNGNCYRVKAEKINSNSFVRFTRQFQGGYTELFEQMVIMNDKDSGEIGSGMMEHLRTFKSTCT